MARKFIMLTAAIGVAGALITAGNIVEPETGDANDLLRRGKGREATQDEILAHLAEVEGEDAAAEYLEGLADADAADADLAALDADDDADEGEGGE